MSFADSLRQARQASSTVLLTFLLNYKATAKTLHIFVEGNDDPSFYANHLIGRLEQAELFYYNCQNKNGVYDLHGKIDWGRFDSNRVLFFTDKDLSDILGEVWPSAQNIFVTDVYSIENYIVNSSMLRRVALDIFHLELSECERANLFVKFEAQLSWFQRRITIAMAWIAYHRQTGKKVHLSDVDFASILIFDADLNGGFKQSVLNYIGSRTGVATKNSDGAGIRSMYRIMAAVADAKQVVRGKFELQFFAKFVSAIPEVINRERKSGEPRVVVYTSLNAGNAVEILGPRVPLPKKLRTFFEQTVDTLAWS